MSRGLGDVYKRQVRSSLVDPLLQVNPYGGVPPPAVMSMAPVVLPKHNTLVTVPLTANPEEG